MISKLHDYLEQRRTKNWRLDCVSAHQGHFEDGTPVWDIYAAVAMAIVECLERDKWVFPH